MHKQNLKIVFMPGSGNNFNQRLEFKLKSNDNYK